MPHAALCTLVVLGLIQPIGLTPRPCAAAEVPLVVATTCMHVTADRDANLATVRDLIHGAAAAGAHLVALPLHAVQDNPGRGEHIPTAEEIQYVRETAEPVPGPLTDWLADEARVAGVYVATGMVERTVSGDSLYQAHVLVGPDGLLAKYRAGSLWDRNINANEERFYAYGPSIGQVFSTPIGRIGLLVSTDMMFLEGAQVPGEPDLVVTAALWPALYGGFYEDSTVAVAQAHGCCHVVANQYGQMGRVRYGGTSRVMDAAGETVAEIGDEQGFVLAEVGLTVDPGAAGLGGTAVVPVSWGEAKDR